MTEPWTAKAARLAAVLVEMGKLRSSVWRAAVENTPRHLLVPECFRLDPDTGEWTRHRLDGEAGMDLVYSNTALFVMPDGCSSSSMPGLMVRMLEDLHVSEGDRVLEIGTGTGYNAALLCHRLGDCRVFSVDVEPTLVTLARERLAAIGYRPVVATRDGVAGLPEHAPFDRVIATCSVPRVPWPWVAQTSLGGRLLVDLKIGKLAGNLVQLVRTGPDTAEGRFDRTYGSFMGIRSRLFTGPPVAPVAPTVEERAERSSSLDLARPWENTVVWFLAALTMPAVTGFGLRGATGPAPATVIINASGGSRCEVTPLVGGVRRVRERGAEIWSHVERAHEMWQALGRPGWERFGLSVVADCHVAWLDRPGGRHHWMLSPACA